MPQKLIDSFNDDEQIDGCQKKKKKINGKINTTQPNTNS